VVFGVADDGPSLQSLFDEIHAFSIPN
jgi:hypothetical protein